MSAPEARGAVEPLTIPEVVDLGCAYVADGALWSAARCFRAVADRLEKMAERGDRLLGIASETTP